MILNKLGRVRLIGSGGNYTHEHYSDVKQRYLDRHDSLAYSGFLGDSLIVAKVRMSIRILWLEKCASDGSLLLKPLTDEARGHV